MSNKSISQLTAGAAISDADLFPDVQTVGVGPVKVTAAQLKTYTSSSPTLVTPVLGVATGTSIALGGATIGSNVLAATGTTFLDGFQWLKVNNTTTAQYLKYGDGSTAYAQIGGYYDSATTGHIEFYTLQAGVLTEAGRFTTTGLLTLTNPLPVTSGGTGVTTSTGSGANVLSTTPTFTTSALFPDGSASAPSIAHAGDTNCGIYFPASDTISISTSGSDRFRVDSTGNIGIGTSPSAGINIRQQQSITGATGCTVYSSRGTIQSDVTSYTYGFSTFIGTAAAAFTLGNLIHYNAGMASIGAGSAVTTQTGFQTDSTFANATANYGFRAQDTSAITAGKTSYGFFCQSIIATGGGTTWNFYADGNAPNLFAGSTIIGKAALSTSATDGFLYIPTCAGAPTGVPTTRTGTAAIVYDTTNNFLYLYNGAWKKVAMA